MSLDFFENMRFDSGLIIARSAKKVGDEARSNNDSSGDIVEAEITWCVFEMTKRVA